MNLDKNPAEMNHDNRINQLEEHMAETRSALNRQSDQIDQILKLLTPPVSTSAPAAPVESETSSDPAPSFVSRRSMLKNAAMATLGAAAMLETMPSAKASNSAYLNLNTSNSSTSETSLTTSTINFGLAVTNTNTGSAIYGFSASNSGVEGKTTSGVGVSGLSTSSDGIQGQSTSGYGVRGSSSTKSGVYGSSSSSYGVKGVSQTKSGVYGFSVSGNGIMAKSSSGYALFAMNTATTGIAIAAEGLGAGLLAVSGDENGSPTTSSGYGVSAKGSRYGGAFAGALAPIILSPNGRGIMNPNLDTSNGHDRGELFVDSVGGLWYCVSSGHPGIFRKMADAGTAGSFALLSAPTRFIDTRTPAESASSTGTTAPAPGGGVTTYIFSGTNALTPFSSGGTPPSIPFGATSLVGRITVQTGKNGHVDAGGELQVSNVNPPTFGSGLILWGSTPSTQILPFVLGLDNATVAGSGQMYFVNTSTSGDIIDIIVDVTGFYF